jgi:hypothetical protein
MYNFEHLSKQPDTVLFPQYNNNRMAESTQNTATVPPEEIIALAQKMGYKERRPSVSSTLFFVESAPSMAPDAAAVLINIYYTTRSIMTLLQHPGSAGTNELWRSHAYDTLEELQRFFENPRIHTGKGYRKAHKAVRGCVGCGMMKTKGDFSKNQWLKGPDANRCIECCNLANDKRRSTKAEESPLTLTSGMENLNLTDKDASTSFPALTKDMLQTHDRKNKVTLPGGKGVLVGDIQNKLVRRQFNCPDCPRHGRGRFVFFKKVPALKPICKCPRCKHASRGKCRRLYPVPQDQEKGYGLFRCTRCLDKWGSSRAVANIGQECFKCAKQGESVLVTPFRLERHKAKTGKMRRVPREAIAEDEVDEREYSPGDRARNESGTVAVNGPDSYSLEPREVVSGAGDSMEPVGVLSSRIPSGYQHKCAGCASGACKNRKVPLSQTHDISEGNTVSTRASVVTDSSVDKADFFDRDEDFRGFEELDVW